MRPAQTWLVGEPTPLTRSQRQPEPTEGSLSVNSHNQASQLGAVVYYYFVEEENPLIIPADNVHIRDGRRVMETGEDTGTGREQDQNARHDSLRRGEYNGKHRQAHFENGLRAQPILTLSAVRKALFPKKHYHSTDAEGRCERGGGSAEVGVALSDCNRELRTKLLYLGCALNGTLPPVIR